MFSKFSLDQTDPISKLGAKVVPYTSPITEEIARECGAAHFEQVSYDELVPQADETWGEKSRRLFSEYLNADHQSPSQALAHARYEAHLNTAQTERKAVISPFPTLYEETEVPRSAYWQDQMGETPTALSEKLRALCEIGCAQQETWVACDWGASPDIQAITDEQFVRNARTRAYLNLLESLSPKTQQPT